ncbi:MAG: hypothetical protein H6937_00070 [Burkholderiales bacterium]|nr:hypothetical protein [Burkholderiales bacterium]MDR4518477.1 contractile injection system tape measure protein [Nitrosomonas sp.]
MITGSDNGTGHIIEEVVLDFVFDSSVITDEHESLMSTWVVDKLLPTVEAALDEYDEKGKVLRIERITIDLGDIPSSNSDFLTQIIPPLYEQLILQLNRARSLGRSITPSSPKLTQPEGHQYQKASADGMTVQQINPFQSDLEILDHFLATGNMPWHVDASNSWAHEKLLERVLLDATGGAALRALMVKIPSNRRAAFVSRLVKQYSNRALEKILIQIAPKQHELMLDLTRAYQSVLSVLQLPTLQQTAAMQQLWAQIFKAIAGHAHALDSFDFSDAIPQILQKLTTPDLLDQNALIDELIFLSKKHLKDSRLPIILTAYARKSEAGQKSIWNFLQYFKVTKTYGDQKTVNDGESLFGKTVLMSEKDRHLSYSTVLFKQIKAALQQTEINETRLFLENLHAANSLTIQKQLFEMLQDKVIRQKLIAGLPSFILIDIAYLLSVQAALIIEQLLLHAVKFHQLTADRNHMTIAEWERQFWENALSFLVSGSLKTSFEATHFVQALVRMIPDDEETVTVLDNWREILVKAQQQEHGALQNIFFNAIATLKPETREIPTAQEKNLITTGLATDPNYTRRQPEATVETDSSKQANPDQTKATRQQSVAQSAADLTSQSFKASTFSYEIARGQSADQDKAPVLQSWPEVLQHQDHQNKVGTNTLRNIILDALSTDSSVSRSFLANQEIKLIIAALETDFVAQRQRLEMASETGGLASEELPDEMPKAIVHAVLKHDPALTDADKQTFIEAIESHARKAGSRSFYYQQVMEKLLSGETINLEEIASRAARHDLPRTDSDIALNTEVAEKKRPVQNKKTGTDILERIQSALKQFAETGADVQIWQLQTTDIPSAKKQLLKYLKDKAQRTQLILRLPQSILLDISYVLSPHTAIILEQLMLYSETLHNKTPNRLHPDVAGWEHQVWKNALVFFVHKPPKHLFEGLFDAASFLHGLVNNLSGENDTAAILRNWHEILKQEHGHEKIVLRNVLVEAISASHATPQSDLSGEGMRQIVDTLTRDYERGYQQLETAFHSGQLTLGKLTENELKSMIRALLKHNPALTGDDSQTFINAIETHAHRAENIALYYQQILEKLLRDQAVDLESIVSRSVDVSDPVLTVTGLKQPVIQSTSAAAAIYHRIRSALIQSTITGTELFLQLLPAANAQTIQKHVLDLLQQTEVRTQIIAKLPKSILFDMIYLLSPQATLVIEQLLSNAKMLFQFTPKKHAARIDEWERRIWENSFSYLLALPIIDASAGRLNTVAFIHTVIDKLSESKDNITVIQSWHNALTKMHGVEYGQDHGTRILRHSIETLLMQQKSGLEREPERSFHPQPLKIRNDNVAEYVLPNKMAEMDNEVDDGDEFYIHNAGQVLAAPYLPQLFKLLGLIEKGVFVNRSAAERAVHLLQFMVNEETRSPEYQLLLNKLLCGLSTITPISNEIEISQHEQETIENLIQGMIRNWKTIGNTSVQGLRETFLQRNGHLLLKDKMWFLTIEPGPFDMLLDQLPWSFSVIKYNWMERAIHVTWR